MAVILIGKRGLGPVLTIAFVILGVMIGVVLLWIFAQKSISRGEDIIDPDCFTVDLDLESCQAYGLCSYYSGSGSYKADILIKRGIGRANLTGLRFSFEDVYGKKGVYDFNLNSVQLEELQSVNFRDPSPPWPARIPVLSNEPHLVRAIAMIGSERDVCPIPSEPVLCSIPLGENAPSIGADPGATWGDNYCCKCAPYLNYSECYPGNDTDYPIQNGVVYHNGNPFPQGVPPGYSSVCCSRTPDDLLNDALPSEVNDPSNPWMYIYWTSNINPSGNHVYNGTCPSYAPLDLDWVPPGGGGSST